MKIAQACEQDSPSDFLDCLRRARAIAMEVECQFLLARDLHFVRLEDHDALQADVIEV
ncbi:MAG: four helix bundle protein [Acidobacteriota bacterium]|nr:four helix bundle protein [Acidobacteriota bacterium]